MSNDENFTCALAHLIRLDGFTEFYESYTAQKEIKTSEDFDEYFSLFRTHLIEKGRWNNDLEITFNIYKEKKSVYIHELSTNPIFSINKAIKLNDNWLIDFQREFADCLSGDTFAEEIRPKRYKTITENIILYGVDGSKLSQLYLKYADFNHPYVNYQVASVFYNAKNFSAGLPILCNGIKSIVSFPNHYWNNESGIEGATWMIGDLLFLLGNGLQKMELENERVKLLKLLFLYMSRYICMTQSNLKSIDFYSNRAQIVKDNCMDFIGIFGLGVNPDIQYISDKYLAYHVSSKNNLTGIPDFMQFMWDSKKMYDHGSHIPNNSGGYKEIEDRTWMELVRDGEIRSIVLAGKLLVEFENYELNISNSTIDKIFEYLIETKKDNFDDYIKKLKDKKLNTLDK